MSGDAKVNPALLKDIKGGASLKHAQTAEKNTLPSVGGKFLFYPCLLLR